MSSSAQKSIIITGGASGIGLAITRHFAQQHHDIAVLDINSTTGPSIIASVQADHPQSTLTFKHCNVASWEEQARVFKEVYEQHGRRMDIVMANAGVSDRGENNITVLEGEDEEGPSQPNLVTVNVNFVGCLYTVKLAAYYMNKNPVSDGSSRGLIICTASNAGLYPFPISPVYSGTKAGIIGLVRSLEKPYAKHNIRINALAPAVLG
ncbi:hypothetical protein LTS08_000427 [Lithohypha guttulata]|nr:hypothetical protein LTS08_000427 [Lithohypha guttulata]